MANSQFVAEFEKAYDRKPAVGAVYGLLAAKFISQAYLKAGKVKTEAFIDAVEGLSVDSPLGPVTLRACDHQATLPMFMGVTKKSGEHDFLMATDIVTIPGEAVMPSCEEIAASRK